MSDNNILTGRVVLITGVAGFIGSNLARTLYDIYPTIQIVGIDRCIKVGIYKGEMLCQKSVLL